jgi:hypothetical protein
MKDNRPKSTRIKLSRSQLNMSQKMTIKSRIIMRLDIMNKLVFSVVYCLFV